MCGKNVRFILMNQNFHMFRPMYSKQVFNIWIPFGLISVFIGCLVETRNYSILFLAFIVSSFRVTEESLVFLSVQSDPCSSFQCFLCSLRN